MTTTQLQGIWLLSRYSFKALLMFLVCLAAIQWSSGLAHSTPLHEPICGTPILVSGAITSNTTWSTANLYILNADVTINPAVTLTIQPGVVVKGKVNTRLVVSGKLIADGSTSHPVHFTSWADDSLCGDTNGDGTATLPTAGNWGWIEFGSTSDPTSSIRKAVIRYGGYYYGWRAAIRLNNISPTLENITFNGNHRNAVELVPGNWTTQTLSSTTVVYWLYGGDTTVLPSNTLTIASGVKIKSSTNARFLVNGELVAEGTQAAPITFTSEKDDTVCGIGAANEKICDLNNDGNASLPTAGDWGWIEFGSTSNPTSRIKRAIIRYGGYYYGWRSATRLNNVSPTLENITFSGNYRNAAEIVPGNWTTQALSSTTVIYWLAWGDTTLLPSETLRFAPGVKVKAATDAKLLINGKLVADGIQASPVTFTSEKDDTVCGRGSNNEPVCDTNNDGNASLPAALDWGWIEFRSSSSPASIIRRAIIKYGGKSYSWNGTVRLQDVIPTLENISFKGNYRNAVEIMPGNWTTHTWNSRTVVYWLSGETVILPNETVTIPPGAKIKASSQARLFIEGKIIADGTQAAKISFTSEKDDTACGLGASSELICDTNNDANTSLPAVHDWSGLEFSANSAPTSLIRWAQIQYSRRAVRLNSASPTIAYSLLKTNHRGLELLSGSRPILICNSFENNQDYGVYNYQPSTPAGAKNQWWNSSSGPKHKSNPNGIGDRVSDGVDYTPWTIQSCLPSQPLFAPSSLKALAVSQTQINLTWKDNASNETDFHIERSLGGNNTWTKIAVVGANVTSYKNSGLTGNTNYYYRVRAHRHSDGTHSSYSNVAGAKTPPPGQAIDHFIYIPIIQK